MRAERCPRRPSYFLQGAQGPRGSAPPWLADPCPPPSCAGPCVTLFSPHVLHDILLPRTAPQMAPPGSSFLGPLPVPWALHTVGVLGRQSRTLLGPHGCSQQAWGGQMWWLWEPPPWGRGGSLRASPAELRAFLSVLDSVAGAAALQLAVVDPAALQEAVPGSRPRGLQRQHGQGPGCMLASCVERWGVTGSRQPEGPRLLARGQPGVPLMRNDGVRGTEPRPPGPVCMDTGVSPCPSLGHLSPRAGAGDTMAQVTDGEEAAHSWQTQNQRGQDAAWPCVVHH